MAPLARERRPPASSPGGARHAREGETCTNDVRPCQRECRTTFAVQMQSHAGTPTVQMVPSARERRPLVGTAARSAAKGMYHAAVRITLNTEVPAERRTTPELGVLLCRPPTAGCADQRSAFPCQRVALHGGVRPRRAPSRKLHFHAWRGVQEDAIMSVSPGGGFQTGTAARRAAKLRSAHRAEARGRLGTPTSGQFSRWSPARAGARNLHQ